MCYMQPSGCAQHCGKRDSRENLSSSLQKQQVVSKVSSVPSECFPTPHLHAQRCSNCRAGAAMFFMTSGLRHAVLQFSALALWIWSKKGSLWSLFPAPASALIALLGMILFIFGQVCLCSFIQASCARLSTVRTFNAGSLHVFYIHLFSLY